MTKVSVVKWQTFDLQAFVSMDKLMQPRLGFTLICRSPKFTLQAADSQKFAEAFPASVGFSCSRRAVEGVGQVLTLLQRHHEREVLR